MMNRPRGLRRKKHFDEFNKKHIEFYPKEMLFYGDNTAFSKEFDCFIVGSDQVWNPSSPFVGANFFLTFAKKHQRLTYAPSFSVNEIPAEKENLYKDYLSGFPDITVREDIGATIVNELAGKPADVVLVIDVVPFRNMMINLYGRVTVSMKM